MEIAMHQSLREFMADCSRRQSCGKLMAWKILTSSANIKVYNSEQNCMDYL
jgi:hypothetical protein